jgi:hypothetical protein
MPDFDKRKIPTLDDVIEIADNEKINFDLNINSDDMLDEESYNTESNLNLFTSEIIDLTAEDSVTEDTIIGVNEATTLLKNTSDAIIEESINLEAEPEIGIVDNIYNEDESHNIAPVDSTTEGIDDQVDSIESALIGYNVSDETEAETIASPAFDDLFDDAKDIQPVEAEPQQPAARLLQSVTDDIVKQLMPELEKQLRDLLEQALKEKLSGEIIQTKTTESSPSISQ